MAERANAPEGRRSRWKLKPREARLVIYLVLLLAVAGWKFLPRPWHPAMVIEGTHHRIYSSATRQQTEETAHALGLLYNAYSNRMGGLPGFRRAHAKLKVRLFRDRGEFREINPSLGWAEAFYREPYCQAYFAAGEVNPYHWMLHESVHQLNREVARLRLEKWLEEGLATYFSTCRLGSNAVALGRIDRNTYPVWWIDDLATSTNLSENIRNGSVIPLRSIITNRGGPRMSSHFNLYYLHWWALTYFIFESPRYRERALELAESGGGVDAFERIIGPVDQVQAEWHAFVRRLKDGLAGKDREFLRSGRIGGAGSSNQLRTNASSDRWRVISPAVGGSVPKACDRRPCGVECGGCVFPPEPTLPTLGNPPPNSGPPAGGSPGAADYG